MKNTLMMTLLVALPILAACETQVQSDLPADTTAVDYVAEIAGDKTRTAELIRQSFAKGTFDDALTLAMQDSALALEVAAIVREHPGLLADAAQPETGRQQATGAGRRSNATTASRRTTTQSNSGDVLDKTERTVKQANEKIDQAGRIKKEAEEAKKKVEDIFKP